MDVDPWSVHAGHTAGLCICRRDLRGGCNASRKVHADCTHSASLCASDSALALHTLTLLRFRSLTIRIISTICETHRAAVLRSSPSRHRCLPDFLDGRSLFHVHSHYCGQNQQAVCVELLRAEILSGAEEVHVASSSYSFDGTSSAPESTGSRLSKPCGMMWRH